MSINIVRLTYRDSGGRPLFNTYGKRIYCSTQATADVICKYEELLSCRDILVHRKDMDHKDEQYVKKELVDKAIKELEEYLQEADKCIGEDSEYIRGWKSAILVGIEMLTRMDVTQRKKIYINCDKCKWYNW